MVRLWSLLAAAISLASVRADEPDISWFAFLSEQTLVDNAQDQLYVDLPVIIQRQGGVGNSLTLTITGVPYTVETESDDSIETVTLYTETLQASSDRFTHSVSFEFSADGYNDYLISASVYSEDDSEDLSEVPGELILAKGPDGAWGAVDLPRWVDIVNNEIIKEEEEFEQEIGGTDDGQVGIGEPIIPDNPAIIPDKPKEDSPGGNGTVTSPSITTPTTPGGGDGSVTSPGGGGGGSTTTPGGGGGGDGSTTTPCHGHGCGPRTLITIRRTTTICPKPTPPPPCPTNKLSKRELAERQLAPLNPAYVNGKIQYRNQNRALRPVRGLKVKAFVDVYEGNVKVGTRTSWQTTNLNGEGTWKFSIREGQRLEVRRLVTDLNTTSFALVASGDNGKTFTNRKIRLDLNNNPWLVEAGETKSYTNTHSFIPVFESLWVANAAKSIVDYSQSKVVPKGKWQFIKVWYPSSAVDSEGVARGAHIQYNNQSPYISILQIDSYNHGTLAHEMGHFIQMLSNGFNRLFKGDPPAKSAHNACGDVTNEFLPFNEGFATAFGLFAIDNSDLEDGYLVKKKRTSLIDRTTEAPFNPSFRSYEDYSCKDRFLLRQEGRIAALLLDLVDRRLDKFLMSSTDRGFVPTDFSASNLDIRFDPRLIFWNAMAGRIIPLSIEDYW